MIAVLKRDLLLALRSGGGFGFSLGFFLIIIVLIPLGVGPQASLLSKIAPGILWVSALLSVLLSLERIFALDYEDGSLALFATSPLPLESLILSKSIAHWLTTGLPLSLIAPLLGVLLHLPAQAALTLTVSLLVGTPALSLLGGFGAALTVGLKRGGLLLSLLILPFYIPTLIFGAQAVSLATQGLQATTPILLLSTISLGCCALLPYVSARILAINLR